MRISLIAALSSNYVIGKDNQMPWHLPADLQRFRAITWGKPILMGRKTHESIGRPLPGRQNIVLTAQTDYRAEGCHVARDLAEAFSLAGDAGDIMVIGGATLYRRLLPVAHRLYLTLIEREYDGDAFFPPIDWAAWEAVQSETVSADGKAGVAYRFLVLDRKPNQPGNELTA